MKLTFLLLFYALSSNFTHAETFFGAGGGYTKFSVDYVSTPSFEFEDQVTNGKIFLGYEFNSLKGIAKFETSYDYYGAWNPNNHEDKLSSFSIVWTPSFELTSQTFITARLGAFMWNSDIPSENKIFESQGGNGIDIFYGISFETPLVDNLSIRFDYDVHDIEYVQFDTFMILLTLSF